MAGPTPYPIIRLVDAPFPPPISRVLMDFNVDGTYALQNGWTLGAPALSGGSGVVGAIGTVFGPRSPSFTQRFRGLKEQAIARMHQMHTACLRGSAYLMFQLSEEERPVWIPTTRSPADAVQFRHVTTDVGNVDVWDITVRFTAFPWALGERVTIGPLEISNDPGSGTNRLGLALPQILGNYGVPVTIDWYHHDPEGPEILGSIGPGTLGLSPTYDVDATNRPVWAGMVTDTDGTYSGDAPSAVAPGRYTVFAAGRPTGTGMRFGISYDGGTTITWGPWDRTSSGAGWIKLGDFTFRPPPGVTSAQIPTITWEYEAPTAGAQPIPTLVLHPILNAAAGEYGKLMSKITSTGPGSTGTGALSTGGEGHFHIDADGRQHTAVVAAAGSAVWQWPVQVPGASQLLAWPQHENWLTVLDDFYAADPGPTRSTWVTITYHPYNHTFAGDR